MAKTTNLGVRSSNLFGRASNVLISNSNFCAIFSLLTFAFRAAPGRHGIQFEQQPLPGICVQMHAIDASPVLEA